MYLIQVKVGSKEQGWIPNEAYIDGEAKRVEKAIKAKVPKTDAIVIGTSQYIDIKPQILN